MLDSGDMGELGHNRAKDFLNSRSYKAMIGKRVKSVVFLALHYYIFTKESLGLEIPMILFFLAETHQGWCLAGLPLLHH